VQEDLCHEPMYDPFDEEERLYIGKPDCMEPTPEEDEEFGRLLDSMVSEANYGASSSKNVKAEIAIPLHIRNSAHSTSSNGSDSQW
jgi:hypothetical protein